MSWQPYIDSSLIGSGNVDSAAIFDIKGENTWARSSNFEIKPDEMKVIVDSFKDPGHVQKEGAKVNGQKYTFIRGDARTLLLKKGKEGLIVVRTKQAMLFGHHPDDVRSPDCVNTVEKLADYLIGVGY